MSFNRGLLSQLTLRIRLKSSLSTLRKWQLSSRRTMEAALGASFTRANLPKSSPSWRVQTTPWGEPDSQKKKKDQTPSFPSQPSTPPPSAVSASGLHWNYSQIKMFHFSFTEYIQSMNDSECNNWENLWLKMKLCLFYMESQCHGKFNCSNICCYFRSTLANGV